MAGWGILPWGLGGFGNAPITIHVASALAVGTTHVRVTLTAEPMHVSAIATGDALNPATWVLTRLDTGQVFTVLLVEEYDPPLVFDLRLLEQLASFQVTHRVQADTLLSASGALITDPDFADFPGVLDVGLSTPDQLLARRRAAGRDLENRPAPVNPVGGTLVIGSDGDYSNIEGAEYVKKLIFRRLTTDRGSFFHLPDYGVGLTVKEPIPSTDLIRLRAEIERQVKLEREVEQVAARVTLGADGVLVVQLQARMRSTGQQVDVGVKVSDSGTVLL